MQNIAQNRRYIAVQAGWRGNAEQTGSEKNRKSLAKLCDVRRHVRVLDEDAPEERADRQDQEDDVVGLKTKKSRKIVKSARYRPILSAHRTRQRPAHVHARTDPAQNGQNGGN